MSDPHTALHHHQQALAIHRETGELPQEAMTLGNIGLAYQALNQPDLALNYCQQSLKLHQTMGYKIEIARQLSNLAELHLQQNQPQAAAYLTEALALPGIEHYKLVHQRLLALQDQCHSLKIAPQSGIISPNDGKYKQN